VDSHLFVEFEVFWLGLGLRVLVRVLC